MNRTFPLLNYHYIVIDYLNTQENIKKLNERLLIQYSETSVVELQKLYEKLAGLELVRNNVKVIFNFLQSRLNLKYIKKIEYPSIQHYFNDLPHINVGRSGGNSVGISRFLLTNTEKSIFVITKDPKDYIKQKKNLPGTNINIVRPSEARAIRGSYCDFVILDGITSLDFIEKVLPNIPSALLNNQRIVRVGEIG